MTDKKAGIEYGWRPKIQMYKPTGELVKTYESLSAISRDQAETVQHRIKKAIDDNMIYIGYRWMRLERNLPDNTIQNLEPTEGVSVYREYVAMLNSDQNRIEQVFYRKFKNGTTVYNSMKNGTISTTGNYFKVWQECSQELRDDYTSRESLPDKEEVTRRRKIEIQQLDPINKNVIKTFDSIKDVMKEYKVGNITIKNAIEFGDVVKGYKWTRKSSMDSSENIS